MHPLPHPAALVRRRWHVPPPLAHGDDVLEGLSVLDDVPGEFGIVLWQALRDASLWAASSPQARTGIFAAGAERTRVAALISAAVPRELEGPLGTLAAVAGAGEDVGESRVSLALREISLWLDERGLLGSALAFAHAGATVAAGDATAAFTVARLARRRAEHVRAETWYRRAALLARQSADWSIYARTFMGLGALYLQRGNLPVSYRFRRRALAATERRQLHHLRGVAHHDLFEAAIHMERPAEAQEQAALALAAYGDGHARVPMLAHDLAYFWMTQGRFAPALELFTAIERHFHDDAARALVVACRIRAAGGAGRSAEFHDGWRDLQALLGRAGRNERHASVMLEAARGAASMGAWTLAEDAGVAALDAATRRGEGQGRLAAEAVLDCVRRRAAIPLDASPSFSGLERDADALASTVLHSLAMAGASE